ncbi:nicotinate-nucleotide--dimethylbenzimidazole phosphoribosyltransferase [Streptomyces sp. ACA25]|uniref:nicotinate-nucleotide--dimethylbenzimidazole phosphoribosyltransferase n=1 Tax=Streptomyces sp. ACA25 TaxID=3022596 RepID=UPI002307E823|nr:nicotinate-nucleotide--dimethylbenzimidazole phosphoribosyltransferase [Streptomyces sp. ACA25]MDB1088962.1 nicotinate-nucleotide--dimethylbenzimidazole phosphoribosyltransferase [Streptomyces sp. ACA25]
MTDTGQVPEGGQPSQPDGPSGSAELPAQLGHPVAPVPATHPVPGAVDGLGEPEEPEEEEDLLMPGSMGVWGEAAPVPRPAGPPGRRDRTSTGDDPAVPASGEFPPSSQDHAVTPPRRPLHLGPPVPEQSGAVRPLADRQPPTAQGRPTGPASGAVAEEPAPPKSPPPPDLPGSGPSPSLPSGALPAQPGAWQPVAPEPGPEPVAPEAGPEAVAPEPGPEPVAPGPAPESVAPEPRAGDFGPGVPPEAMTGPPVAGPAPEPDAAAEQTAGLPAGSPEAVEPGAPGAESAGPSGNAPESAERGDSGPQTLEPGPAAAAVQEPGSPPVPEPGEAGPEPLVGGVPPRPEPEPDEASPPAVPAPRDGSAPEQASTAVTPAAPGYAEAEREAVHRLMRDRRDIRNGFRSDPIPHEVLLRVLEAAHTAPSVGHSQPWDFVIIRSAETRQTMHELVVQQREAYAKSLPKARAKQFKELKVEAILDTPVNIVVTADPTRGGRHTLGRHTQPQMAPYSSALAVENLWLAARAEGLGVGWVSFFDERELVRALHLPDHLEVVAYLCVGYVDEFPDEPELVQAGWSRRRPLSWVVHEESYGRRALPGAQPHDLLGETLEQIRPLDAQALGEAWERQKRMTKPAGALGALEIISAQLCGLSRSCPPPVPEPAAVAVFAGDHGVHAQGVTSWPQEVTAQMVANFLGGGAVCNAFANQVGAEVCVVDVGVRSELPGTPGLLPRKVRAGTADFTCGPALTREEVLRAIEVGIETARDLVAAGNRALLTGEMGIANTTVSAALIAVCTGTDPAEVTGRGTGINDETHARKIEVVRRGLELHRPDPADPLGVLAAVGGLEHAAITGLILGGASLRVPVLLDGVSAGAAALVARAIAPEAVSVCIAGHRSAEPGHMAALTALGLRPLVDLDLRLGEGTGALLALPIVQSAARAMREVATFDSAGVTDKN